jgi:DNA-binding MarR family transcriptional regulator
MVELLSVANDGCSMSEDRSNERSDTTTNNVAHELQLLEAIALDPETTQADLAAQVGVAIGTVNWYLKRWSKKGYVKIRRISRWQWSYLLTPEGIARKTRLAGEYIEASLSLYRRTRSEASRLLGEVRKAGYQQILLLGEGEIAEICRLTCLELGIEVISDTSNDQLPTLQIENVRLVIIWPSEMPSTDSLVAAL